MNATRPVKNGFNSGGKRDRSQFYGGLLGVSSWRCSSAAWEPTAHSWRAGGRNCDFCRECVNTNISFLWYNVLGCVVVIIVGVAVSRIFDRTIQGRPLDLRNAADSAR
jgi:hypothetical protein